jgi:hypothetical protein
MDYPLLACSCHKDDLSNCKTCLNNHEISIGLLCYNKKLIDRKRQQESKLDKLKALISIAQEKIKAISKEAVGFEDNLSHKSGESISEHLSKLLLPTDLFSIFTREDLTVAFMVQSTYIPPYIKCPNCRVEAHIVYYSYTGYAYICFLCKFKTKIKAVTMFQNSPLSLEKVLLFVFLWVLGLRDQEISSLLEVSKSYISGIARKLRQMVGDEFSRTLPVFSGVVEIDEMDFIKRKIEIGKSKTVKKWVMIMAERDTRQFYMEYIPERKKEIIVPIIQRMCLPGTVIITKEWGGYGRLEDLGFCHFTYFKSQGFTDPNNPNIHHSNIKNSFTWLKYQIKTRNRSGNFLQEYILEWLWRKRLTHNQRDDDPTISTFKALLQLLGTQNKFP